MFKPFDFQNKAIKELVEKTILLYNNSQHNTKLVLDSPTGSGKTFMVCNTINELNNQPHWDRDKCFIWLSFNDELINQSRSKHEKYFGKNSQNRLLSYEDFNNGKLEKNDVLFLSWSKLSQNRGIERLLLRRPDNETERKETGFYFEDIIENTKRERDIVLIIDENHKSSDSVAARKIIDIINPKVSLLVSATPTYVPNAREVSDGLGDLVYVKREDVVREGLIKESIVTNLGKDLDAHDGEDLDYLLLDAAIDKREYLKKLYTNADQEINPLVLIQVPNENKILLEGGQNTYTDIIYTYLINSGILKEEVAIWLDKDHVNLSGITNNNSKVKFVIFKQAIGTGWDCPRAEILVMYRDIKSTTFETQTLGRILRNPNPEYFKDYSKNEELKHAYLYTSFTKEDILKRPDKKNIAKFKINKSVRDKSKSKLVGLTGEYIKRISYGDIVDSIKFKKCLINTFDNFFDIRDDMMPQFECQELVRRKGVKINTEVNTELLIDKIISDTDNIDLEFSLPGGVKIYPNSANNIEKLFNNVCYNIIKSQSNDSAISNASRSWSPLKGGLRAWFELRMPQGYLDCYRIFLNDIRDLNSSVFYQAIIKTIKNFEFEIHELLSARTQQQINSDSFLYEIADEYYYYDDCVDIRETNMTSELSVVNPVYLNKPPKTEEDFINYLESRDEIEWWFKNGDSGKEYYSIKYYNTTTENWKLFYPDFIIKFKDGRVGIFDTKDGITAENPQGREVGLYNKLKELNKEELKFVGGLVVNDNGIWRYNEGKNYSYNPKNLGENWKIFNDLFN